MIVAEMQGLVGLNVKYGEDGPTGTVLGYSAVASPDTPDRVCVWLTVVLLGVLSAVLLGAR